MLRVLLGLFHDWPFASLPLRPQGRGEGDEPKSARPAWIAVGISNNPDIGTGVALDVTARRRRITAGGWCPACPPLLVSAGDGLPADVLCRALIPGTGVVYTLSSALGGGIRRGLIAAVGCTLGILPHIAAALLGLSGILQTGATLFEVVRWAAWPTCSTSACRCSATLGPMRLDSEVAAGASTVAVVCRGVLLNLLNPKLTLFFFAFLPQFLDPGFGPIDVRLIGLGALFMLVTLVVFAGYAYAGAAFRDRVLVCRAVRRFIERTIGAVLIAFAARLASGDR